MTDTSQLGHVEKVDLRSVWPGEATDFTPWLAQDENLCRLGEAIKTPLQLETIEQGIGIFRADIIARSVHTGQWVLIENQLERSDHGHLGQVITYASSLKASTVVWIAGQFTYEHRTSIDWLNSITENSVRFFAVQMEVWRIGQSDLAPVFNIVSAPNEWTTLVSRSHSVQYPCVPGVSPQTIKRVIDQHLEGVGWTKMRGNYSQTIKPVREAWEQTHGKTLLTDVKKEIS